MKDLLFLGKFRVTVEPIDEMKVTEEGFGTGGALVSVFVFRFLPRILV